MCAKSLQSCPTLCDLWTVAHQAPLSMGFSRQEYWSEFPCPPPGDLPDPGIEPESLESPALAGRFFTTSVLWGSLDKWQIGSIACAALNRWCCCSRQWIEEDSEASMNRREWIPCDQFEAEGDFQVFGGHSGW